MSIFQFVWLPRTLWAMLYIQVFVLFDEEPSHGAGSRALACIWVWMPTWIQESVRHTLVVISINTWKQSTNKSQALYWGSTIIGSAQLRLLINAHRHTLLDWGCLLQSSRKTERCLEGRQRASMPTHSNEQHHSLMLSVAVTRWLEGPPALNRT